MMSLTAPGAHLSLALSYTVTIMRTRNPNQHGENQHVRKGLASGRDSVSAMTCSGVECRQA